MLSGDVITITAFIFGSMKDGIREWKKQKMKKLPDRDKGKQKEGAEEVRQINWFC